MHDFRLLHFKDNILVHAETIRVRDVLEAIEAAAGKPVDVKIEIWSDRGRAAILGEAPDHLRRLGRP